MLLRRAHEKYLLSIDFYELQSTSPFLCSPHHTIIYYEEMACRTVADLLWANMPSFLPIVTHSLFGFQILYEKYGYFRVDASMVMWNTVG